MKIVVIGTRGIPGIMGGVETHCEELFPRVAALGYDVTVVRRRSYVTDSLTEWKGVKLIDIATPRKKAFEAIIHTARAVIAARRLGADVVHIHAIGPALVTPLARMLGIKVVFTHHGPDYDRDKWGAAAKFMLRLGEKMGCAFADRVIVISDVIRNIIAHKHGRTAGVSLVYNGVPAADKCHFPEYFDTLGIAEGKYVLGMSRFVPEKNLHHIIEAFDRIRPDGVKLVLAGDSDFPDEYSVNLKRNAAEKGVVLTGFVKGKHLHSLLTNALCFVLPSSHEGLPIALLEAMSYNLPVIVSDIPANLEVGLDDDCYFPMGDVDALARRLKAVCDAGFCRVDYDMSKYDWDCIARKVSDVYRSL